jgi:hypothetical protein
VKQVVGVGRKRFCRAAPRIEIPEKLTRYADRLAVVIDDCVGRISNGVANSPDTHVLFLGLRLSHSGQWRNRLLQIATCNLALRCIRLRGCGLSRYRDAIYSYLRATIGSTLVARRAGR